MDTTRASNLGTWPLTPNLGDPEMLPSEATELREKDSARTVGISPEKGLPEAWRGQDKKD